MLSFRIDIITRFCDHISLEGSAQCLRFVTEVVTKERQEHLRLILSFGCGQTCPATSRFGENGQFNWSGGGMATLKITWNDRLIEF